MRGERVTTVILVVLAATVAASACGRRDERAGGVRVPSEAQLVKEGRAELGDPLVVAPLRTPPAPGRIIYDPPADLSYASLERTRPDLLRSLRPDTIRTPGVAGSPSATRDTTGGDAALIRQRPRSRDTSGASRP